MGRALSRHFPLIGNGEGERFPTLFLLLPMATVPALPLHSPPPTPGSPSSPRFCGAGPGPEQNLSELKETLVT